MLVNNRIDIPEGSCINKTTASKKCHICHYWCFKDFVLNMNHVIAMVIMI